MMARVLAALVLVAALGCGDAGAPPPVEAAVAAVELSASIVESEEIVEPILGTGVIMAHKTTDVSARVEGIIDEIYVEVGARVSAGDPLFRIRQIDYQLRLDQEAARLRLARAEAQHARRDLERTQRLSKRSVVSVEALDEAQTAQHITAAKIEAAEAAVATARQDLADTVVTAPYDGVITQRNVDEGAFMRTRMAGSSPVIQIMKVDVVFAIVHIPEVHLPRVAVDTPARVRVDGLAREYDSSIYIMNDLVEHSSHSIELRLPIQNEDLAIKPGLFVKAEILPAPRQVVTVDRRSILGAGAGRYVFIEQSGRAVRRGVRVQDLDASRMEVLAGLDVGDRVLRGPNLARVDEGTAVKVRESDVAL